MSETTNGGDATVEFDDGPTQLSGFLASALGVLVTGASGPYDGVALVLCVVGTALVLVGIVRGSRGGVTVGCVGLLFGALAAGVQDAPTVVMLFSVTASVLAWDTGQTAIDLGEQLGRGADTRRLELTHLFGSVAVGTVTAVVGYLALQIGTGGQPVSVLLGLLVAALLLLAGLRRQASTAPGV
jgi:hypothetical protein